MEEYRIDVDWSEEGIVAEPETAYAVNRELNLAWQIVEETGSNLFLTGRAGTGKTTFLRRLRETTSKRMVVLAPTGVAAINARGSTIHSFFQFPFSLFLPGQGFVTGDRRYVPFSKQKKRILASMSLLVIDEVSMVRPDILDAIDSVLRRFRNRHLPFGGVQLLLIGDLRQLPPVVKSSEWDILSKEYASPYFFESHALQKAGFQTIELTTIYRQRDVEFITILNQVRDGRVDYDSLLRLNERCRPGFEPSDSDGYIRLTTHNHQANAINVRKLDALPGAVHEYHAEVKGDFSEFNFPVEPTLRLKEGAQVMFVKNDTSSERRYYNGMLGRIVHLDEDVIKVKPLDGDTLIDAAPVEWENTRYVINEDTKAIDTEVVGTFRQYPLKLAWAITIHKSQGLTFSKAVIDAHSAFAAGQTYVALSRCTSLDGLVLSAPIPTSAVIIDRDVNNFVSYCEQHVPDERLLADMKRDYTRRLLTEIFDFSQLKTAFRDFMRSVDEYLVPLYPSISVEMREACGIVENDLEEVGRKFVKANVSEAPDPESLLADGRFLERVRNGCAYFLEKLEDVAHIIERMPKEIGNALHAKRLNSTYDVLADQLELKTGVMDRMKGRNFSVSAYLMAKGVAAANMQQERGAIKKSNVRRHKTRKE